MKSRTLIIIFGLLALVALSGIAGKTVLYKPWWGKRINKKWGMGTAQNGSAESTNEDGTVNLSELGVVAVDPSTRSLWEMIRLYHQGDEGWVERT
ncbi:MAG TPA: hypothetical protein PL010_12225 [Flavobacteriales bacterium]|nr:hypothetical protein [Flavobacteriales bacterium]HNE81752.1 hypothetical protein [Flavobacteriales bacterium]HNI05381.1 hypothetical protein [Flavobacteriales bacterium]HNK39855.1 hypothetical protein [Flavobacteriales bacterium]HNO06917.1 hypothetical protein [Flavobacteriales bacterium]